MSEQALDPIQTEKTPASGKRKVRQHYLPQLHLRHFLGSSPKNMVWVYDNQGRPPRPQSTKQVGFERNFYSVQKVDGTYDDRLDDWLTDVENKAVPGYTKLLSGTIPIGQERADFATFLASLFVRSPKKLNAAAALYAYMIYTELKRHWRDRASFERLMDEFEATKGPISVSRDEIFNFGNDPSRFWIEVLRSAGLRSFEVSDDLQTAIFSREWHVVSSSVEQFVTCDSPVAFAIPGSGSKDVSNLADLAHPDICISFPLATQRCLLIAHRPVSGLHRSTVNSVGVHDLNNIRLRAAERFVFSAVHDQKLATAVVKLRTIGRFTINGHTPPKVRVIRS